MKLDELLAGLPAGIRVSPTPDFRTCLGLGGVGLNGTLCRGVSLRDGATCEEAREWFRVLGWEKGRLNGRMIEVTYFSAWWDWWPVLVLD